MPKAMPSAMLSFECCNRLCRLPEQELSALPMLNCSMLNLDIIIALASVSM